MSLLTRAADGYGHLRQVFADPRGKATGQIVREVTDVAQRTGSSPEWYFINFAYRREAGDYTQYLHRKQGYALWQKLMTSESATVLHDKLKLHELLRGLGFPLTTLLADNDGATFRVDGTERHVGDHAAFVALVRELLGRSATGSIFAKPVDGSRGHGCHRIDSADANLEEVYAQAQATHYLFEETLIQHPSLAAMNPPSVNTIRVLTCGEPGEPATAFAAILRLGVGGSAVDNASHGGIFVGLEMETGRLFPEAREFFKHGGNVYTTHPDNGFRFEGAQVPHFDEVLKVAERATAHVPHDLIGWDIAVTEAGPVIIEGNASPHLPMMEIGLGQGLLAYPPFRKLCQRMMSAG
ncbi:MAG TPA: sugar-transfer associated ATP-grasp domain-containing protein [Geminicoccus sp.]|uniref:sugar-transfer associated ATP-grasp domain-containing protein n=1 Tax=Geminicoccus sp. TaxID=2024832 RepID=UPI002E2F44FF|nr:sugar-transfer associated ATP-grasp domain-containing protein [Geminicoccus sp.]HEX2525807.1 sugar-transfer associated ATP-grasp domain-containing protein [Geminicoccus sp.]